MKPVRLLALSCIAVLLTVQCGAKHLRPYSQAKPDANVEKTLHRLWNTPLALETPDAERILRSGFKYEVKGRNWRLLTQKLTTPGSNVTVVVFGGSITVGHYRTCENSSWAEELFNWMVTAFPHVTFNLVNLGHCATAASVASLCYYHDMPDQVDLVVVEYSVNGCGALQCLRVSQPEVAAYENMLRKIITKAPQAALIGFAAFAWKIDEMEDGTKVPNPFYNTGEDQHGIIAKRYGMPMVSVRDALYDIMFDDSKTVANLGMTREEFMMDHIHPQLSGAKVYGAGLCAWGVRHMVTLSLLQSRHQRTSLQQHARHMRSKAQQTSWAQPTGSYPGSYLTGLAAEEEMPLPPFVSPLAQQSLDSDTYCAAGLDMKDRMIANDGWQWVDEGRVSCKHPGCRKYGWMSKTVGSKLEFKVDSSNILTKEQEEGGNKIALTFLFLRSHNNNPVEEAGEKKGMGVALFECISGCSCAPLKVDAVNTDRSSELDTIRTEVTAHPECVVRVTIMPETSSGGHKFRLNGAALAPYTDSIPLGRFHKMLFDQQYLVASEKFIVQLTKAQQAAAAAATANSTATAAATSAAVPDASRDE